MDDSGVDNSPSNHPDDLDIAGANGPVQHEDSIRVFVRIRPLNKRELAESQTLGWSYNETSMIEDTQNGMKIPCIIDMDSLTMISCTP